VISYNDMNPPLTGALILFIVVFATILVIFRISAIIGTQLKKAEQTLSESEKKYRILVENLGEGIGIVDTNEIFLFANPNAEIIFGVGKGELIGRNLKEFYSKEQYLFIQNQTKIRKEGQSSSYENEFTLPNGIKRSILITAVPQFNDNKDFIGTLGIFRDITERKLAEQALTESERKLFQLNNDKDRFISILGHDLRSPFTALLGLSEILKDNIQELDEEEIKNMAGDINITAQNTFNLLEDLLKWARSQQGKIPFKPQNLSFEVICEDAIQVLKPVANAKNIIINYKDAGEIKVFADIDMLKTVLRNLVSNAIKFTNNGGAINITAKQNNSKTTITVSDNGIGINPDNLSKLFDVGQILTTKGTADEKGTGLGLLLCKEFVEKHGGKIWVESEAWKGSEFRFLLPDYNDDYAAKK
jgi:PAS domain S-box-containing protein